MSVFKAFFTILKKNKMTFILAIAVNIAITFAYIGSSKTSDDSSFEDAKSEIAIINQDDSLIASHLVTFLQDHTTIVAIDTSAVGQQDAIFFDEVAYILTIPANFSADFLANKVPQLPTKSRSGSQAQHQVSNLIDLYLNKLQFYRTNFPEKNEQDILAMVTTNLEVKANVTFQTKQSPHSNKKTTAKNFNLLAYGLFMSILSSIGMVSISLNRQDLKNRNNCSPLSERERSQYFYLAIGLFSLASWIVFVGISLVLSKASLYSPTTQLMLVNAFVFLLTIISLAAILSYFVTSTEMIAGLNNILILGSCFISGAFVPQELLSDSVLKIASFFPTYWFISNNNLIASIDTYNRETLGDFYFNLGVLLLFLLVFNLIGFIARKERGGLKKTSPSTP